MDYVGSATCGGRAGFGSALLLVGYWLFYQDRPLLD